MIDIIMEQLILWFNIIGFTLLFGSLGTTYVLYRRTRPRWLFFYLLYLAVYALYTIINTYSFFDQVYLPDHSLLSSSMIMTFSFSIALLLLLLVPRFILSLFLEKVTVKHNWQILLIASVFPIMAIVAAIRPEWPMDRIGSVYMNTYLGGLTLLGALRFTQQKDRASYGVIALFLWLSGPLYIIVALQSLILPFLLPSTLILKISILTAGIISFLWGAATLGYLLFRMAPGENNFAKPLLSDSAARHFGLTPREKEITSLLIQGKSNREIGEELYVSTRTVETHIYNIYRKCSVKNKLELAIKLTQPL